MIFDARLAQRQEAFSDDSVILAEGLTRRFGDFTAVDGIDLRVQRGEVFGLLGPNGSGKTTTIRMLLGLLAPSQGAIEVLGVQVKRHPDRIRQRVGYMSQRFSLYNDLTVRQNLYFYGRAYGLRGKALRDRSAYAVHMAGLDGREDLGTHELSGGWRQRLALGAAILHQPELIFLDEPTAGVDPVSRRAFWELLYDLVAAGASIFVTTHYMEEAEHCHRLAFIQRGRLIAQGTPQEIKSEGLTEEVLEIESGQPDRVVQVLRAAQLAGVFPIREVALYGARVHVVAPGVAGLRTGIGMVLQRAGVPPSRMAVVEPSLEDVFIAKMSLR